MRYELSKAMVLSPNNGTNMVHTVGGGVGGGFEDQKYETCMSNDQAEERKASFSDTYRRLLRWWGCWR